MSQFEMWWVPLEGLWRVRFGYNPAMVRFMQTGLPRSARRFDGRTKCWIVAAGYGKRVREAAGRYFTSVRFYA